MKTFIIYALPIIMATLCAIFMRRCLVSEKDGTEPIIPRSLAVVIVLFSFIPLFGLIEAIALLVTASILACDKGYVRKNKFTRYWLGR